VKGRFGIVPTAWLDRSDVGMAEIAVLTALSTYADKDGYCFPSQRRIADQLNKSQPWVSAILKKLAGTGLITRRIKGTTQSYEYRLLYDVTDQRADTTDQPADMTDQPTDTNKTTNNTNNNPPSKGRLRSPMVEGWTPRREDIDGALERHDILTEEMMSNEIDRFVNYWLGKGDPMADWNASFRNWLNNAAKFAKRDAARNPGSRTAPNTTDERRQRITDAALEENDSSVIQLRPRNT
jgi:DNA-binding Lrp family transcriptional regulator